jgi:hypothetical protein
MKVVVLHTGNRDFPPLPIFEGSKKDQVHEGISKLPKPRAKSSRGGRRKKEKSEKGKACNKCTRRSELLCKKFVMLIASKK